MRKWYKILIGCVVAMSMFIIPVYAQPNQAKGTKAEDNSDTILLPIGVRTARDVEKSYTRGEILSTAIADITDGGNGDIILSLQTIAHVECDEIRHKAFLEQWDEKENVWYTVDSFLFVETKKDHPDDEFIYLSTTIVVKGQPRGRYYRLRGSHSAWLGMEGNSFTTRTDGVLIK